MATPLIDGQAVGRRAGAGRALTEFRIVSREPLRGGQVSALVELIEGVCREPDGSELTLLSVVKRTTTGELTALRAVDGRSALVPELLDSGVADSGPWILTAFTRARHLAPTTRSRWTFWTGWP